MDKNKQISDSTAKANYHRDRAIAADLKKNSVQQINYSTAFTRGDQMGWLPAGHEGLLKESRRWENRYEKKAYWRGVNNRHKREHVNERGKR